MKTEKEIMEKLEEISNKKYPDTDYFLGGKDGYINALQWVLK